MNRIPFRKTGTTFHLNNPSPSPSPYSMELLPTRSLSVEFPTSTNSPGEEKLHPSHAQHPLVEVTLPDLFTCNGCKEHGAGRRFSCHQCDFQLHDFCAFSPPVLRSHPLHVQHQLAFYSKPKPGKIFFLFLSLVFNCYVHVKQMKVFSLEIESAAT